MTDQTNLIREPKLDVNWTDPLKSAAVIFSTLLHKVEEFKCFFEWGCIYLYGFDILERYDALKYS